MGAITSLYSDKPNEKTSLYSDKPNEKSKEQTYIEGLVENNCVVVFAKVGCPFCKKAKDSIHDLGFPFEQVYLDERENNDELLKTLGQMTDSATVPRVFINGKCIGGGDDTEKLYKDGSLKKLIEQCSFPLLNKRDSYSINCKHI